MNMQQLCDDIKRNVILGHIDENDEGFDGDMEGHPGVVELVRGALEENLPATGILPVFSQAMNIVGQKFESGEYLIPDMLASAECVGEAMTILQPHLSDEDTAGKGCFIIATVEGDLHDIGKNIVATMLRGEGYEVRDLGINVKSEDIVQACKENNAEYLGLSALLTTTMVKMEAVMEELVVAGIRDRMKVLIGGAPTTPEFTESIGADAHCSDAFAAVKTLEQIKERA